MGKQHIIDSLSKDLSCRIKELCDRFAATRSHWKSFADFEAVSSDMHHLTGLCDAELASAVACNPRAYMALRGAVAERHLQIHLEALRKAGQITSFRRGYGDFAKDFYVRFINSDREFSIECKNVEVIKVGSKNLKLQYFLFLFQIFGIETFEQSIFKKLSAEQLEEALRSLPIELRESGLPRFAFSRKICELNEFELLSSENCQAYLESINSQSPVTVDFQKTRNSKSDDETKTKKRLYSIGDIDIVAACLFSRTLVWEFIFCRADRLPEDPKHEKRHKNRVQIDPNLWKTDLLNIATELLSSQKANHRLSI